jgi:hypothetical protein
VNELKCPAPTCLGLMGSGKPYVTLSALASIRTMDPKWLEKREPNGHVFKCPECGCTVDIPVAA